ncbi:hypothetical protein RHMOL_Rhmol01G0033100 [Rhododendron molle]|uniref:Uncharacterized protein n=1 Tax=Rhododendron molle TaxID=49168 RepID=A0ACC0PZ42_RHOML|nr:hypothetical protein RHMOL_Rhmol01G0033100 [Rhododendron molle]
MGRNGQNLETVHFVFSPGQTSTSLFFLLFDLLTLQSQPVIHLTDHLISHLLTSGFEISRFRPSSSFSGHFPATQRLLELRFPIQGRKGFWVTKYGTSLMMTIGCYLRQHKKMRKILAVETAVASNLASNRSHSYPCTSFCDVVSA